MGKKCTLIEQLYNICYNDLEENDSVKSWASGIRDILNEYGYQYVWMQQGVNNIDSFIQVFQQRMIDCFIQKWYGNIHSSPRAFMYRNYGEIFGFKDYLDVICVKKYRIALSQLRMASHLLYVETGRWGRNRIERHLRICTLCKNDVEDEYHFTLSCSVYADLRKQYIPLYYYTRPSVKKFVELFTCSKKKTIRNLAVFAFKAFTRRSEILSVST